jgi:hypothetical protein
MINAGAAFALGHRLDHRPTIRPLYYCLTCLLVGLAVAVFAWGLQYKLSLYHLEKAISQRVPEAKLLSKDEQPDALRGELTRAVPPRPDSLHSVWPASLIALLSLCGMLLRFTPTLPGWTVGMRVLRTLRPPHLPAFFFRPPPVLS